MMDLIPFGADDDSDLGGILLGENLLNRVNADSSVEAFVPFEVLNVGDRQVAVENCYRFSDHLGFFATLGLIQYNKRSQNIHMSSDPNAISIVSDINTNFCPRVTPNYVSLSNDPHRQCRWYCNVHLPYFGRTFVLLDANGNPCEFGKLLHNNISLVL